MEKGRKGILGNKNMKYEGMEFCKSRCRVRDFKFFYMVRV